MKLPGKILLVTAILAGLSNVPAFCQSPMEAFVIRADELISDLNYDSDRTDHYRVKTDDPRFDVTGAARLLESFHAFFEKFWSVRAELRPYETPGRIYLFYSRYKYRQLLNVAEVTGVILPVGHYQSSFDVVAIHTDTVPPGDFPDVLVHEAAHQLVQNRLLGRQVIASIWLAEGLAAYFGYTMRDAKGNFQAGRIGGKQISLIRDTPRGRGQERLGRFSGYRRSIKRGKIDPIEKLLGMTDPGEYYGQRQNEHYAGSWLLVHFLLHADGGVHAAGFSRYIGRESRGEGGADSFSLEIGLEPDELQAAFRKYVLGLKAR